MARPRSDIRERIVGAALPAFLERGVDGASLRHIAKRAGTSLGMITYYFGTKDALFMAVVDSAYSGILADLEAILAQGRAFPESVVALYHRFAAVTAHETDVLRLVVKEGLSSQQRRAAILRRFGTGHIPLVLQTAAAGQRDGEADPELHTVVVGMCLLAVGGIPQLIRRVAQSTLHLPDFPEPEVLADQLAGVFLTGIRPGRPMPKALRARVEKVEGTRRKRSGSVNQRSGAVAGKKTRHRRPADKKKPRTGAVRRNEEP